MHVKKLSAAALAMSLIPAGFTALGAQVWQSTFDAGPDGVVNVVDNDTTKVMIGPASGGRLQITTKDKRLGITTNDRAGRPLGATLNGNASFSGLYKFRWSGLSPDTRDMWEGFGFIGDAANYTRQVCGGLIRHRRDANGDNFLRLGVQFGEAGSGSHFYRGAGSEISLGQDGVATSSEFYLAVGFDGEGHVLSIAFYDSNGVNLGQVSADLDATVGGLLPSLGNSVQTMLDNLAVTHLGWNDYTTNQATPDRSTVWQVDSLTYFSDAQEAFNAVPSQTLGACCEPNGSCSDGQAEQACLALGGTWSGAASQCATAICPDAVGACCLPDGSCTEATESACTEQSGTWQGGNTACTLTDCPQPPIGACCSALDGSCTDGLTTFDCEGTWQGADTLCANVNCPPPAGGACCLPNGACVEQSEPACLAQCGTWRGAATTCASAGCPQDPAGACCAADGTCSELLEWQCTGAWRGSGTTCATADCEPMPSLVWWNNFHSDLEGLEDVRDNNPTKDLFEGQCDGRAQVRVRSRPNNWEVNDRGGKSVGTTLTGNDSFSGLYRFRWSDLPESADLGIDHPAFVGDRTNCTQQLFGVILLHNFSEGNYFVRMCTAAGESQYYHLFQCGATYNLGPDAETTEYQFAMSYEGTTHLMTHSIFDAAGNLIGADPDFAFQTWDFDIVGPEGPTQGYFDITPPQTTKQEKYDATALTHLGWSEYTAFQAVTLDTAWDVDSLAYFNDAAGAYNAVFGATNRGACCLPDGSCADNFTELACLASGGGFSGVETTCATTSCLGACCITADARCVDNQSAGDCSAQGGTFQGLLTDCATTDCPLPPCKDPFADADGDDDVDSTDFALFQACIQPFPPLIAPARCHCFDRDGDDTIDGDDFVEFLNCNSGPSIPVNPACDD